MPYRTYRTEAKLDAESGRYRALLYYPADASIPVVETRAIYLREDEAIRHAERVAQRALRQR